MPRKLLKQNLNAKPSFFNVKNAVILLALITGALLVVFALLGPVTQEKLEDFIQDPQSALASSSLLSNEEQPKGQYANLNNALLSSGNQVIVPASQIGGGVSSDARLELTPEGPKYTYDVKNDAELQVILAALFFHGKYAFPEAQNIIVTVNFPDKPSKTFTIPASTVEETREEHANFTEFYENVTTT